MSDGGNPLDAYFRPGMPGYVLRDWEVIDYQCYELAQTNLWFRGPQPATLRPGCYFSAIGAAQTFGCFCPDPYPALLQKRLDFPALNLGYSGAGPAFFLRQPQVLAHVNRGAFCIVQVMSARSTSNSKFDNPDGLAHGRRRSDGQPATSETIFKEALWADMDCIPLPYRVIMPFLKSLKIPLPHARRLLRESRSTYIRDFKALMDLITVPKILLWFSERKPSYMPRYDSAGWLLGRFPHLVNEKMVGNLSQLADRYVECVSNRGLPQPLISRFSGGPVTVDLRADKKPLDGTSGETASLYEGTWETNAYYPSPEMHEDAANVLEASCRDLAPR